MTDRDGNGRFTKGNCANPKGRPTIKEEAAIADIIDSVITIEDWRDVFKKLLSLAKRGSIQATNVLLERKFGKIPDALQHSGRLEVVIEDVEYNHKSKDTAA
jgi:hypothetical protein